MRGGCNLFSAYFRPPFRPAFGLGFQALKIEVCKSRPQAFESRSTLILPKLKEEFKNDVSSLDKTSMLSRLDAAQPRVSKRNQGHPQHNRGALKHWVALHLASMKHTPLVSSFSSFSSFSHDSSTSHLLAFASEAMNILARPLGSFRNLSQLQGRLFHLTVCSRPSVLFPSDLCAV